MKRLLYLIYTLQAFAINAQSLTGVWEGEVFLREGRNTKMSLRLELLEQNKMCYGILYTRASQKGSIYGCDYIVSGQTTKSSLQLKKVNVQRSVGMSTEECGMMNFLLLLFNATDSSALVGNWGWTSGVVSTVKCKKVSDEISPLAVDELTAYRKEIFDFYEAQKLFLEPEERMNVRLLYMDIDSSDFAVELRTDELFATDSIDVYVNDELVSSKYPLSVKPLRIKLQGFPAGENELLIVNRSTVQFRQKIKVSIYYKGANRELIAEPSFVKNSLLLFSRN
ncbi:MAG: hypothetical protein ACK5DG_01745 [Chitinophagaceae bacterium]|jgi:hypothetical protein